MVTMATILLLAIFIVKWNLLKSSLLWLYKIMTISYLKSPSTLRKRKIVIKTDFYKMGVYLEYEVYLFFEKENLQIFFHGFLLKWPLSILKS